MTRVRVIVLMLAALLVGVILGGYLFSDTRPRSFLALNRCEGTCLQANELLGLAASVGVQKFSGFAPSVVKETDKTIVIESPRPQARVKFGELQCVTLWLRLRMSNLCGAKLRLCGIRRVDGLDIHVQGLDAIDGTPVLDLKPYMREFEAQGEVRQPDWARQLMAGYW